MNKADEIKKLLASLATRETTTSYPKFFKTGKGQYAENDIFIGVNIPNQRKVAKAFWDKTNLSELSELLSSKIHEHRHTALLLLIIQFEKATEKENKKRLVEFYLNHLDFINNWDLVDTACYKIIGKYCFDTDNENIMLDLSKSHVIWHKRIAIVGSLYFVKNHSFTLSKILIEKELCHPHDLIRKANGWILREIGKMNENELLSFLRQHHKIMPRTTLCYAIEKLDKTLQQNFLKGTV